MHKQVHTGIMNGMYIMKVTKSYTSNSMNATTYTVSVYDTL